MGSQGAETVAAGRFPAPHVAWMVLQLPKELHGLFGFRGEEIPGDYDEEIEYLYEIAYPDGSPYLKPVLVHYIKGSEVPVAFIIGDEIELDDVTVVVKNHVQREVKPGDGANEYTYHQVTVALPEATGA